MPCDSQFVLFAKMKVTANPAFHFPLWHNEYSHDLESRFEIPRTAFLYYDVKLFMCDLLL